VITVRENAPRPDKSIQFFAQAGKWTNQNTAPYTAGGWGATLLEALSRCIDEINRFPYEGE
jgi:hypothetical protein